ncbi:Kynurenine formamidase [Halobacillus dabanensis]|uniref:Kynurenine formamidase n=1 Tax=Halobacillus dabanensis TaxID=240302 RepID=A0A1I4AT15_HALDA|nr:arylformamidase [Halobacillus dabanensis]SFK59688.1 Kynurenine formamidase [Halobacillus dabanensis]
MNFIDISMPLTNNTPPWPGDEPFEYKLTFSMEETGSVNVGQFKGSNHIGTHIDAPFHYDSNGWKTAEIPLERFSGPALVVPIKNQTTITAQLLQGIDFSGVDKVLFHTGSWEDRTSFPNQYTVIGEDVGPFLNSKGIHLIGVDTPSVDPETSKELVGHHSLYNNDILILEGIQLSHVPPGIYELFAFPLKMEQADGSPVRAVLRPLEK